MLVMAATKTVPDENLLDQFRAADKPVLTAAEVADGVDLDKSAVNYRLNQLADAGTVRKQKVGARAAVWWIDD